MKRLIIGYLAAGLVFCGFRWADLALWTDQASGLVTAGPVWVRYAVLAVFAVAALAAGRAAAGSPAPLRTRQWAAAVPALAGTFLCVAGGVLGLIHAAGVASVVRSVLTLACGGWLGWLGFAWVAGGGRRPSAWLGVAGTLVFVWQILNSFMTNGSSWYRTVPTSAVWQQLSALLFLTALLRVLCLPEEADGRAVGGYGLLAFCLCFCWQLPRCVLLGADFSGWALAAVGLLGGVCALLCAAGEPRSVGSHAAE